MEWPKIIICVLVGLGAGAITAAGTFALITVVGILPRLAGYTHTAKHMHLYEWSIIAGGIVGNILYLFPISLTYIRFLIPVFGLALGVFVSSLVMSLAETIDVMPILVRRFRIREGFAWIIVAFALGKVLGSLGFFSL
ncbi:MAG: stage V sporulation protein AB [Lachnospiraceae bacterium]